MQNIYCTESIDMLWLALNRTALQFTSSSFCRGGTADTCCSSYHPSHTYMRYHAVIEAQSSSWLSDPAFFPDSCSGNSPVTGEWHKYSRDFQKYIIWSKLKWSEILNIPEPNCICHTDHISRSQHTADQLTSADISWPRGFKLESFWIQVACIGEWYFPPRIFWSQSSNAPSG